MPNNFQLIPKGKDEPASLSKVDEELCELLDEEVDPKYYVRGWFDIIGFRIAMGKELGSDELRESVEDLDSEDMMKCLNYLEEHYTSKAWYSHK